jgi:hypothetical protein
MEEMAAKEYKVNTAHGTFVTWANSAEQAARRVEREIGKRCVTQRSYISNRTDDMTNVKGYEDEYCDA